MLDDIPPGSDDDENFPYGDDPDDPEDMFNENNFGGNSLAGEEEEVRKNIKDLYSKIYDPDAEPVSNEDILKYIRVINFNFAALSRLIQAIFFRQGIMEEGIFDINKKVTGLTEADDLIDEALRDDPASDK